MFKPVSILMLGLSLAIAAAGAHADTTPVEKVLTPQQMKMRACNAQAKADALKGDDRRAFMSQCLRKDSTIGGGASTAAKPAAAAKGDALAKNERSEKRKACGAEAKAKSLKGDERKAYVKSCVKGEAAAA